MVDGKEKRFQNKTPISFILAPEGSNTNGGGTNTGDGGNTGGGNTGGGNTDPDYGDIGDGN
jgi:hypothetical protein